VALTADKLRLRVPLDQETQGALKGKPRKLKQAELAQPALLPGHPLPLVVGFWRDAPSHVRTAGMKAIHRWNRRMAKHTGVAETFIGAGSNPTKHVDLMIGCREFDIFFDPDIEFGEPNSRSVSGSAPLGGGEELGDCELYWDEEKRVYVGHLAGRIFVPDDLSIFDTACVLAHELGHGLLLGHDPIHPWRLMYKDHTGVRGPKPKECRWIQEIWT
tara:strand:- start:17 stop:664 length:648 start_codon:yes stop_codon:yes gene_type:complete